MKKSEIFVSALKEVSNITEIPVEQLLFYDKSAEIVDARFILVKILSEKGFYVGEIASYMKRTKPSIHYILSNFDGRIRFCRIMEMNVDYIRKALEKNV